VQLVWGLKGCGLNHSEKDLVKGGRGVFENDNKDHQTRTWENIRESSKHFQHKLSTLGIAGTAGERG